MKGFKITIICLILAVINSYSQTNNFTSVSCYSRGEYDVKVELDTNMDYQYVLGEDGKKIYTTLSYIETGSIFIFKNDYKMFTHITERITSNYYLTDPEDRVDLMGYSTLSVVSDAGNNYEYIFDTKNNVVSITYMNPKGQCILIEFRIKTIF